MLKDLRRLSPWQRRIVVISVLIGVLLGLVALTVFLVTTVINPGAQQEPQALLPEWSVARYGILPDSDAYPAAAAVSPDGSGVVYTGSYATGAIWAISPDGTVREIPGTRAFIGAVSGLAFAPDGALLVVDQADTDPRSVGGSLVRIAPGVLANAALTDAEAAPGISTFGLLPADADDPDGNGFIAPNDVAVDALGRVYVTDPGRNEVWRFEPDGSSPAVWWVPPVTEGVGRSAITGIGYDAARAAMLITDPELNRIYRASIDTGESETLYEHGERANPPGFDGIAVTPDGTIYVAALGQNGIAIVQANDLDYVVGLFRGAADVKVLQADEGGVRLIVPNFDQASIVIPLLEPQLPFTVDVLTRTAAAP
jgi:sugar lactone lactonase YvrE